MGVLVRRVFLMVGILPCLSSLLPAQTVTRGPYLQLGTPSSMIVRWRTSSGTDSRVEYGSSPTNLTQSVVEAATGTTDHEVTLTGLSAETKYYYSVGTTSTVLAGADADHFFVTSPPPGAQRHTRLWVIGDSGTGTPQAEAVRDAFYGYSSNRRADLLMMLGDNAYDNGTDIEYQSAVFEMYPQTLRNTVTWPTFGNHDGNSANSSSQSGPYYDIFTLPAAMEAGGVMSGTEAYYSFDHGNIHFICLDSDESDLNVGGDMLLWLESDLAATSQEWIVAFWHHPPYTKGSHDSDNTGEHALQEMRENALPILEDYGVDLVLTGHSHSYERSYLLDGHYGFSSELLDPANAAMYVDDGDGREDGDGAYSKTASPTSHEGAVYAVAGSSGKITGSGSLDHPAMFYSIKALGSMVLDVYGNRLNAVFLDSTGVVLDYFSIVKGSDSLAPLIVSTQAVSANQVLVEFVEPMDQTSSEVSANYVLDKAATVTGAVLQADLRSGLLTTGTLAQGVTETVTINNVKDTSNNTIGADSEAMFLWEDVPLAPLFRFQDGVYPDSSYAGTRDTYISEDDVSPDERDTNFGAELELLLDGSDPSGTDKRSLLKWDVSTSLPAGTAIESASLVLDVFNGGGNYKIYKMLQSWEEDEATWNDHSTGQGWQVSGVDGSGDRESTELGQIDSGSGIQTFSLNPAGVAAVQGWIDDPTSNKGFLMADDASTNGVDIRSREVTTATSRPMLQITLPPAPSQLCLENHSLITGSWQQIALSCDPGSANTVEAVFGDDLDGVYKSDWVVFERTYHPSDSSLDQTRRLEATDPVEVGRGYWIKTLQSTQTVQSEGILNGPVEVPLSKDPAGRFNLVGHPFPYDVCWESVEVIEGGVVRTLSEAHTMGLMERIAYKWTGSAYAAFDGTTPGAKGTLLPFDGLWVKALDSTSDLMLRIPDTPGVDCEAAAAAPALAGSVTLRKAEKVVAPWYVRLIAESGSLSDSSNVLGQLPDSVNGFDSHDLKELPPFSTPYLSIVFPHPDWGDESGDHTSDFHSLQGKKVKDEWYFEVVGSEIGSTVTLRWEAAQGLLDKTSLIDARTGKRLKVRPEGSYSFTMESNREGFYWRVGN